MEFYFIRHGQSQNNANWQNPQYQESPDPELTDLGREQALCLADYFASHPLQEDRPGSDPQNRAGYGFTHIYSSLMVRAPGTALPTVRSLGMPLIAWPEIHEEGGIFSRHDKANLIGLPGKTRSYFEQNFPELQLPAGLDETGWWNRPFEAEEARQPRADQFLADLLARHGDRPGQPADRVAVFSHGGFFCRLMCAMLQLPWRQAAGGLRSWFLLNNASISRFDFVNKELSVNYLNRTDHLPTHLVTG